MGLKTLIAIWTQREKQQGILSSHRSQTLTVENSPLLMVSHYPHKIVDCKKKKEPKKKIVVIVIIFIRKPIQQI